jgi:hypothetical protein
MGFAPLITPAAEPISDEGAFVLPFTVGEMVGKGRAKDEVTRGFLRPRDIDTAEVSDVERIFVPLWRFEGSVDGFHVGLTVSRDRDGRRAMPLPTGGFRHQDGTLLVLARRGFPIDPSARAKFRGKGPINFDDRLGIAQIATKDLVPLAGASLDGVPRVEPDLPLESAEKRARKILKRQGEPHSALYAKVDVELGDAMLCYYPLWVVRYRYRGEAVEGEETFFAAVSGTTGKVVASHHPSALKSLGGKLRGLFGG